MRVEGAASEWRQVRDLFEAALELPPGERASFVQEASAAPPQVRAEVEALLAAAEAAGPWIERSAELIRCAARAAFARTGDDASTVEEEDLSGRRIGTYRVVRELARGGMGTVYEAARADGLYEQRVALKVLRRGLDTDDILARFLTERQILASLAHANIARLLDGGTTEDGRPYLVLEYVEGEPITDYCDSRRLNLDQRLELFTSVCGAVEYAHRKRVLHRDLKPSNILVTPDGHVKLLDFGIAKLVGSGGEGSPTRTGVRLMTPEYASPEQLCGGVLGATSDVYQLGMLLYELLAGVRPYRGSGTESGVCRVEIDPPSVLLGDRSSRRTADGQRSAADEIARRRGTDLPRLRRSLRGDVDAIVCRALRTEATARYPSVTELIDDLERRRRGLRLQARRGTLGYRLRRWARRRRAPLAAAAGLSAGLFAFALGVVGSRWQVLDRQAAVFPAAGGYSVAVGQIRSDDLFASRIGPVRDLLATSLSRIPDVEVLSPARMAELLAQVRAEGDTVGALARAARLGGAGELIEGTLRPDAGGFALDLSWLDLGSGRIRQTITVRAEETGALAEQAAAGFANWLGVALPGGRLGDVSTRSHVAHRLYEEGLRAYYDGDNRAAQRFLTAALDEDSAFAMAAYYRALSYRNIDHAAFRRDLRRATHFAMRASDRERLLIESAWAREMDEPRQLALAETLVVRYPSEPDGHLFLGEALLWSGEFHRALPHLRRVAAMDSLSLSGVTPRCRACDALRDIVTAFLLSDSLLAAEREARTWVQLQPASARAWHALASTLEYQGRTEEARFARNRAARLGSDDPRDAVYPAVLSIRSGDFEAAERLLAETSAPGSSLVQQNVLWYETLSLRYQGRFTEALESARRYRRMVREASVAGHPVLWAPLLEAQVLFEMGHGQRAAELWREISSVEYEPDSPARNARHRAWTLTQAAAALAAAGDTAALPGLADTIQALGNLSAYGRDPRLHHYVRGLLLLARGDTATAAAVLHKAVFSGTAGYGRINLELGRALLGSGRPAEALKVIRSGLSGPLDAGNLYVSRTELYALLARAHRALGARDSAVIYSGKVLAAWERADPQLHAWRETLQRSLAELQPDRS